MLTFKDKKFYLDGEEFYIHSASMHYFRALPEYWEDLLTKIKAAGFNCVETYTCWNLHERRKGEFNFSGGLDIEHFLDLCADMGLKVILRTGPYICGEWENGGFPSWLLKDANMRFRCNSEPFMTHLRDWFSVLLPKIKPYLESNGGPVIAMAVENEYGSFGDDFEYLKQIEKIYRDFGMDCLLLAADGAYEICFCTGRAHEGIAHASDFGVGEAETIKIIDKYDDQVPYFSIEYWAGNYTCWGDKDFFKIEDNQKVKKEFEDMIDMGASFNVYMMYGGTNFGFTSGVNTTRDRPLHSKTCFMITSYDYDSALTEWGGYTERYFVMKEALEKANNGPSSTPLPKSPVFQNIGEVKLTKSASLFDNEQIGKKYKSNTVECMEHFDQINGYILYRKVMDFSGPIEYVLMKEIHDRAYVYLNGEFVGVRTRLEDESSVKLPKMLEKGDVLEILVENMGRMCFGPETYLGDRKGILGGIFLLNNNEFWGKVSFNWEVVCFEMDNADGVCFKDTVDEKCPAFFKGTFKTDSKDGCFVHFDNFKKGVIYINGFNLGRYWERGPQTALYLPGALLKEENEIVVFEAEGLKGEPVLVLNDKHGLGNRNPEVIVK